MNVQPDTTDFHWIPINPHAPDVHWNSIHVCVSIVWLQKLQLLYMYQKNEWTKQNSSILLWHHYTGIRTQYKEKKTEKKQTCTSWFQRLNNPRGLKSTISIICVAIFMPLYCTLVIWLTTVLPRPFNIPIATRWKDTELRRHTFAEVNAQQSKHWPSE
jgi:hypothetical protein